MVLVKLMVFFALLTVSPAVKSQDMGDPKAGLQFAEEVCAECHFVSPLVTGTSGTVPSFKEIANTPGMTERALVVFFRTPHVNMPNFLLDAKDELNVIAYIMSLKDKEDY